MRKLWPLLLVLAGCKYDETDFVEDFAEADCTWLLQCYDDAALTFLGWDTVEACLPDRASEIGEDVGHCEYDPKAAKECVKQKEVQACFGEGEDPTHPGICDDVFSFCQSETEDTGDAGGSEDTGDSGA